MNMGIKELWSIECRDGKTILEKNTYNVFDYDDCRGIESLNHREYQRMPHGMHERIYNEDPKALLENYLEWLTEVILPRDIKNLEKLLAQIKTIKALKKGVEDL